MKKLFLSIMLCASFGLLQAGYVPTPGPLTLGDSGAAYNMTRGAIMKAIIDNNPANPASNPKLAAANAALSVFDGQGQNFRSYQAIMSNIAQSTSTQAAINAAQAIETVIMHLYDYDTYLLGGYAKGTSIFASGVRYNNLFYDDKKSQQLINELEKLSNVVKGHSNLMSARLKTTVHSYRHWRRNLALTCVAYLAGDLIKHGRKDSILNLFHQRGLKNSGEIAINHALDLKSGVSYAGSGMGKLIKGSWNFILKPFGKYVGGGVENFKDQKPQAEQPQVKQPKIEIKSNDNKPGNGNNVTNKINLTDTLTPYEQSRFDQASFEAPEVQDHDDLTYEYKKTDYDPASKSFTNLPKAKPSISEREKMKQDLNAFKHKIHSNVSFVKDKINSSSNSVKTAVDSVINFDEKALQQKQREEFQKLKQSVVQESCKMKDQVVDSAYKVGDKVANYIDAAQAARQIKQKEFLAWLVQQSTNFKEGVKAAVNYGAAAPGKIWQHVKDSDDFDSEIPKAHQPKKTLAEQMTQETLDRIAAQKQQDEFERTYLGK